MGLPAALGGTPRPYRGGGTSLPVVVGVKGSCSFWGPSAGFGEQEFEDPAEPVRLDGRVTAPEGVAVSSLPVWVRITPPWMRRNAVWIRGSQP